MDYKEKYLKLKHYIVENNQRGSGRLNPLFVNNLSNLSFVLNDNVLGDDAHAVILSLIDEFNKIAAIELKHNLELSQYYDISNSLTTKEGVLVCNNCEIVLKYIDTTVCITNSKARQHITEENNKHYHTNKQGVKSEIDCMISRGLVRFYVKQREGNVYRYTRIRVVNVQTLDSLRPYMDSLYQNNDEISKLEEASNIAISKGQSDAIRSTSRNGQLEVNSPQELTNATQTINNIVTDAKNAIVQSQLGKMNNQRVISSIPTQSAVNAANAVANSIMKTNAANIANMTTVLIPNNEPMSIFANESVNSVPAVINSKGIISKAFTGGSNTMNSKIVNNRSSIAVDANLAVVPTNSIATDKNINVSPSSKSLSSLSNKLVSASKDLYNKSEELINNIFDKTGQTLSDATNKVKDLFGNKADLSQPMSIKTSKTSVIPVSQNMSVMTSLPKEKAITNVPVPQTLSAITAVHGQNDNDLNLNNYSNASQKTIQQRFENKINKANSTVNLNNTNRALAISKNGNVSIKRAQEISEKNQPLQSQKIISTEIPTTNNTMLRPSQNNISNINNVPTSNKYTKLHQSVNLSDMSDVAPINKYTKLHQSVNLSDMSDAAPINNFSQNIPQTNIIDDYNKRRRNIY